MRKSTKESDWRDVPLLDSVREVFERQLARRRERTGQESRPGEYIFAGCPSPRATPTLERHRPRQRPPVRQYALRQRAVALGWPVDQIVTIDCDQGHSGASAGDREGFQQLVVEVGMGRAGIVLGLEVSRLARNNADWHRRLAICGLSDTLTCDEDGLYNPADFNDRLLLGLKGTMSEAELHFIRARLRGGQLTLAALVVDLRRHSGAALAAEPGRDAGSVTLGRAKDRLSHATTNAQRSLPAAARGT